MRHSLFYKYTFLVLAYLVGSTLVVAQSEICDNGLDDDGDGLIDCYDPDCSGASDCEGFFFNPPVPDCGYQPPQLEEVLLDQLYKTDEVRYPVDQRSGVFVGDMNNDGVPDLVSRANNPRRIQIYSGDDGRILQSIATGPTQAFGQTAIADVDADGNGDVFHLEYGGILARYEFGNANPVWRTSRGVGDNSNVTTPQIADVNEDGRPEVYVGNRVFDALTGRRVAIGSGVNRGAYTGGNNADSYPIFYNVFNPGDARPGGGGVFGNEAQGLELIAGHEVYTLTIDPNRTDGGVYRLASRYNGPTNLRDGLTSIADINGDGRVDVATMDAGDVYAWDPYTQQIIGAGYEVPGTTSGGRINIGDFDGDGDVELGFAGRNIYVVRNYVDNDGDGNPNNGTWSTLWQKTGLDDGSQRTGSTLFDFDGDGTVEVVYSEEEDLFIYEGPTGAELFRTTSRSGTRTEYPIVADVDGDGTAEIIVTAQSRNGPSFSGTGWISVYKSNNQPWVPARKVWNQHGYHVTNINDDLTVPRVQQSNQNPFFDGRYNNFLVQTAIGGGPEGAITYPAPDAIIDAAMGVNGLPLIDFSDCPNTITITLRVDNEGSSPLPASTPVTFYAGDPRVSSPAIITTTTLPVPVPAGTIVNEEITISVADVPPGSPIFLSVNDPGIPPEDLPFTPDIFPLSGTAECDYTNNVSNVGNVRCGELCGDGEDNDGDNLIDEPNLTQFRSEGCPREVLPAIGVDSPTGTWSIVGGSAIGTTVDQNGVVTLGVPGTSAPVTETVRFDDGICVEDVTVTTRDDEPPTVICPGNAEVVVDATCSATLANYVDLAQYGDNCFAPGAVITGTQAPAIASSISIGANPVTITATDEAGNQSSCTFTVTGVDRTNPTIACPDDATVTLDAGCDYRLPDLTGGAAADDNCTAAGDLALTQVPGIGQVRSGDGTNVLITLTARDESGNTANCTYTLTLEDETPPTISCPTLADQTASFTECTFRLFDYRGQVQRSDNCSRYGQITLTQTPAPGTPVGPGVTTITVVATDAAGNATTCTFDQAVIDRDPPQLNCPGAPLIAELDENCEGVITDVTGLATITDNCGAGGLTVTQSPVAGSTFTGFFQNVTVTATDQDGNSNICVVSFVPRDVSPPVVQCPVTQIVVADEDCQVSLPDYTDDEDLAVDPADNCGVVSIRQSPAPGTQIRSTTQVTLTVSDAAGNTGNCTFDVTVPDNSPPFIDCGEERTIPVDGTCTVPLPDYGAQAFTEDNCSPERGGLTVTQSPAPGEEFGLADSPVTVTLTVTDPAGNDFTCTFDVVYEDDTPPQISCPVSPQTDPLDANCEASLPDFRNATDVQSMCGMSTFTLVQSPAPGTVVSGEQIVPVTITAADGQGNTVSCTFNYETEDVTAPTIACPTDATVSVDGACSFALVDYTGQAVASDNCSFPAGTAPAASPVLSITQSPTVGTTLAGAGTTETVTLTATDAAGNATSCSFTVTTEDTTDPTIDCPADQVRNLDANCTYDLEDLTGLATTQDNCPGPVNIQQSPGPGAVGFVGPGTQEVTLEAIDASGNQVACSFTVSFVDVTPPTIQCPSPITLDVNGNCEARVPSLVAAATADDNCEALNPPTITQDVAPNTLLTGDGSTSTVTLTATDAAGLTASCQVVITLDDVTPPSLVCPAAQDLNLDATGCQVDLPDYTGQLSTDDNCTNRAGLTIQQMPAAGTTVMGANTVQAVAFDVNDGNGNTATCSFNVTLRDVTPPVVDCPANATLALDEDCSAALPDYTTQATATDDCAMTADFTFTQSPAAGTLLSADGASRTVTITANDGNGNTSNCSFTVTAEDQADPMIVCPMDREVEVGADCTYEVPDFTGEASVLDNCSEAAAITVTQSPAVGTTVPADQLNRPQLVTLTAEDAAGNTATCNFFFTPVDRTDPAITCPAPQTIFLDDACSVAVGDFAPLASATDNCTAAGTITITQRLAPTTTVTGLGVPQLSVVLEAEDASGNTDTCQLTVFIRDDTPPTVDCSAANLTVALDENCNGEVPDLRPNLVLDDNCSPDVLSTIQTPDEGAIFGGDGTTATVTFEVSDASGNSTVCVSTITFEDQSPPDPVTCPDDTELKVDDTCPVPLPDYTGNVTVLDNCRAQADIVLTQSPTPGTMVMTAGTVVPVTITADDGNGNTATCTFDVTLFDDTDVELTCPGGQIVIASNDNCDGEITSYLEEVTAVNQCMVPAGGVTFTQSPPNGTLLSRNDLNVPQTVTIEATDINNNVTTCTFAVTLVDTLGPALTCPTPQVENVNSATCLATVDNYTGRNLTTVTDNCYNRGQLTITQSPASGSVIAGPDAVETITVTAVDPDGNQNSCSFQLTVRDRTAPALECPEPDTILVDASCQAALGDYTNATAASDNCTEKGDITLTQSPLATAVLSGHLTTETVTVTGTDASGNVGTCSFTVTARDTIRPTVSCPGDQIVRPDADCNGALPDYRGEATALDNCSAAGQITLTQRPAAGEVLTGQGAATRVTIIADDGNGNLDSCVFTVTLEDNVAPTIACPEDAVVEVDENCSYDLVDLTGDATVLDNCTAPALITVTQSVGVGQTFTGDATVIPVTLTADDGNGNTAQCVTTITLDDRIAPTITCPAPPTIFVDDACEISLPDYRAAITDDNCTDPNDISVTQDVAPGTTLSGDDFVQVVTLTADDGNDNTASCSFEVTLQDNTPPTIDCPTGQEVFVDGNCTTTFPDFVPLSTAADNCTMAPATAQNPLPNTPIDMLGTQTVTLTADDGNGNTTDCTFALTVTDNSPPALVCPPTSVIAADEACTVTIADYRDSITVTDNCGPLSAQGGALTLVQNPVEGVEIRDLGTERTVTITATDPSGNSTICMITVEVADTTRPTIACPADTTLATDGNCGAIIPDYTGLPQVTDNCAEGAGITVTQSPVAGTSVGDEASLITVTLTATDEAGNFITCDFAVQLIDSVPPTITCPLDDVVEVDGNCEITLLDYRPQASATDNCSQAAEITYEQRPAPGETFSADGTVVPVTIVAVDQSGNRDSCEFTVTLDDAIDPVIVNCPSDTTLFVDATCSFTTPDFWSVSTAAATDNCTPTGTTATTATGDQIGYTQSPAVGQAFTGGMTTEAVTLTADDGNGNTVSCTFTLSLSDTTSPVITVCPADTVANPNADCEFTLEDYTLRAVATDNCVQDGAVVFTQSPAPGTVVGGEGATTEITITATDASGNTATCTFDLSLDDDTPPTIDCPDPQVQLVDAACAITLNDFTNLATTDDNCSAANVTVTQSPTAGTTFTGVQTQTITLTADDGNGNTTDCTFTVSIEDEIDPALTCPATSIIPADANCDVAVVSYLDSISVTDNCDAAANITLSQDVAIGTTINGLGASIDVTVTAEDQSGNIDQCIISVQLIDTISPTVVCPRDTLLGVDATCSATLPDYREFATPADNCNDPAGITLTQDPPAGSPLSTEGTEQVVTITATDASGNFITCDFSVTLIDTIAPVVACPPNDTIGVDGACEIMVPDYTGGARPTDNCTDPAAIALTQSPAPGTLVSGDGTTRDITITATDASGNESTCTFSLTLEDRTDPTITCPIDQELTADGDCEVPIPDYTGDASVSSTCEQGNAIAIAQVPAPGTPISGHNTSRTITLTATDNAGNSVSCSFQVTLIDRTAPTIVDCPAGPIVEQVDGDCEFLLRDYWEATAATATDNCQRTGVPSTSAAANQITYTQAPAPFTTLSSGVATQVVTLTADDTYGNTTSCQFTVELQDTVRPVITVCPRDTVANPDANCEFALEDYTARAQATDNCAQDGAVVFAQTPVPGTVVEEQGSVTEVTITATDANGNATTCSFELTLQDTIPPTIDCPVAQTETLSATCTDTIQDFTDLAVVADNCTGATTITVTQDPLPGTVFSGVQVREITLTANDGNGNTTSCTFNLNIVDEISPELTCPAQSVIAADLNCEVDVANYLDSVSVTDNCDVLGGGITLVQDVAVGTTITGLNASIDVTVTAADASGNTDQCVIVVTLADTTAPVLSCAPDTVLGVDGACAAVLPDYRPEASVTDNCEDTGTVTFSQSPAPGTSYTDEATSFDVTITATDVAGNATSCSFTVQLIDTVPPSVVCPSDKIVEADGDCEIELLDYRDEAQPSDNCSVDGAGEITLIQRPAPGETFSGDLTVVPVTIVAVDQSGNRDSCTFDVTLDDTTPPVIATCQNDTIGVVGAACNYTLPDYWNIGPATAVDNCRPTGTTSTTATGDQLIYTQSPAPGTVLSDAFTTQTITLTADDQNGNTISCDFVLTLSDTTRPTIVCPADTTANPNANCDFALEDYTDRAVVADNCTDAADLVITQNPAPGTIVNGQAAIQAVTLIVTDPSGNRDSCTFDLTLQDTIPPSIVCPQPKVEELNDGCDYVVPDYTTEAVTDDNCTDPGAITVTQEPLPGEVISDLNEGDMVTITLTADDGNGNTTSCDFSVTLDDVIAPVIACPADATVFVDDACTAALPDLVAVTTATDNCADDTGGSGITITQTPLAATDFNGDNTNVNVTLTADDGNGNSAQCQVLVTLQDTTRPSIVCPPNEVLTTDAACEVSLPDYTVAATVADNCTGSGAIAVTQDIARGSTFDGEGTTQIVTLTADDGNGNTNSCTLEITVDDNVAPTIDCPGTQTQFVTAACDVELLDYTTQATTDDNCTDPVAITVTQAPVAGTRFDGVQNTTVTLTADDGNGNTTECQFTVRFEDNTVPSIVCPAPQEIAFGEDCGFTLPDYRNLAVLDDNCTASTPTVTQSPSIDSLINGLGTVTNVTLTATDASGNASSCQFSVTNVSPTPPPAFATVALAVIPPPVGTGTVNLRDALDDGAPTNLSNIDLDRGFSPGPGPYLVSYYVSPEDAEAETGGFDPVGYDVAAGGEAVIVRLEDPTTGCFTLSQILLDVRTPGTSGAIDASSCSRPGTVIEIDGLPQLGGQGSSVVRHQWRIVDGGGTSIETSDLINADAQVVGLPTGEARRSGTVVLEYQFFEEYGDGPVVPSVPKRVAIEILNVGGGEFFWDGSPR